MLEDLFYDLLVLHEDNDLHPALAFCTGKKVRFLGLLDQSCPILSACRFGALFEEMLALFIYFDRVILIIAQDQVNGLSSTGMRVIDS